MPLIKCVECVFSSPVKKEYDLLFWVRKSSFCIYFYFALVRSSFVVIIIITIILCSETKLLNVVEHERLSMAFIVFSKSECTMYVGNRSIDRMVCMYECLCVKWTRALRCIQLAIYAVISTLHFSC